MSQSWYLYTEREPQRVLEVDAEFERCLDEKFEEYEAQDYSVPTISPGGRAPPTPAQIRELDADLPPRHRSSDEALARLGRCRATASFDYVRVDPDDNPLVVGVMRFWLTRLEPCLMDWGEGTREHGERVLARLRRARGIDLLAQAVPLKRPVVKRRAAKPGELRAIALLAQFDAAAEAAELAVAMNEKGARVSEDARRYLALLLRDGPLSDAAAAKRLGLTPSALRPALAEIERAFLRDADDADHVESRS